MGGGWEAGVWAPRVDSVMVGSGDSITIASLLGLMVETISPCVSLERKVLFSA